MMFVCGVLLDVRPMQARKRQRKTHQAEKKEEKTRNLQVIRTNIGYGIRGKCLTNCEVKNRDKNGISTRKNTPLFIMPLTFKYTFSNKV